METHHITPARGLSETGLKWIALVTMVLDHIHYFFSFTGCVPEWFSMVGRLGAPLFLFCLVEGFTHTHSRKRLFLRQDNRCFGETFPIQALPAAVTVRLVFPFESSPTLGANWETSQAVKEVKAADMCNRHWFAEGHLSPEF